MGSASSTNVKEIQISGSNGGGGGEEREKRPRSRQRESSATSRKSITSAASERIRSSLGSRSSLEKDVPTFYAAPIGSNEGGAKQGGEDLQARQMQRQQISALEMRNLELSEEVQWLRGQICRVPQSIFEKPDNEDYHQRCEELQEQLKSIKEEKAREKDRYEATIRTVHSEALVQVRDMHQKYELVQSLNARLEDTIKENLGASIVKMMREQMNQENRAKLEKITPHVKKEVSRGASMAEVSLSPMTETKKRSSEPIITFLPISKTPTKQNEVFFDEEVEEREHKEANVDFENVYTLSEQFEPVKMVKTADQALTYNRPPSYHRAVAQANSD